MQNKDKFGIFNFTRELIEKHLQFEGSVTACFGFPVELPKTCDDCTNPGEDIKTRYKKSETELISFIGNAAKRINTANDLVHLFRDSCKGFALLGLRFDMLFEKVMGRPKASEEYLLSCSLRKDITHSVCRIGSEHERDVEALFDLLPGELIEGPLDSTDQLVYTAYNGGKCFENDSRALMAVYLLSHLNKTNAKTDLSRLTCVFNLTSCANCIVYGSGWKNRSVIGYFDADKPNEFGREFINEPNVAFTRIFTDKLDTLFLAGAPDDYLTMRLRYTLYDLTATSYFIYSNDALHAYHAVNEIINMHGRNETITEEQIDGCEYRSNIYRAIVLPRYDIESGQTYTINKEGLLQYTALIDSLGLSDMPGFAEIAARIRAL